MKKEVEIHFKNLKDFQCRIAKLWQQQKEDEIYCFTFSDKETEKAFEDFSKRFQCLVEG
jgi:hypothetical protein